MLRQITLCLALGAGLMTLAGCEDRDPYLRTDVWKPTGDNAGNIAAMAANPYDLIRGHGVTAENSSAPALAVDHIWTDNPKSFSGGGGGGGAPSGGGSGGSPSGGGASGGLPGSSGS